MKKILFLALIVFIFSFGKGASWDQGAWDSSIGKNETYGSGWNGDVNPPEKDDVYDYLHQIDIDDDGDVDNLDATYFGTLLASPGEMGGTTPFRIHLTDFYLESADVAHGITSIFETNQFGGAFILGALNGGVDFYGITDADQDGALRLTGIIGATDPTDTYAATIFRGGKKNGTGWQALGNAETAFRFYNYTTAIGTAYGNGEWILTSLQNTPIGTSIAAAGNFTTGNFTGQVDIKVTTTSHAATEAATAATMYGNVHKITGAYVVTLPAAVVGMSGTFRASTAAAFSVDCNGSDHFEMYDGTVLDAGDKLTSSGVKNEWIDIYCESANTWIVRRQNGVIVDGGV